VDKAAAGEKPPQARTERTTAPPATTPPLTKSME
jgi:hypothetical protein